MIPAATGGRWLFPTFLGIGAPKAGTTWLFRLLDSHAEVVMSAHRKEIHYFDLHFDQGPGWYQRFFPADGPGAPRAVGEFTPHYLYDDAVPERVRSVPSIERFLLVLRNPVDRAFSHYRFRQRQDNQRLSFEEFLDEEPNAVAWGFYGRHLRSWFEQFDRERFLLFVFESALSDLDGTKRSLARHLDIDPSRFPAGRPPAANDAFSPRRRRLYSAAVGRARWLRRHQLDPLITAAKRAGLVDLVKRPDHAADVPPLSSQQRLRLWERFEDDVALLEELTELELSHWRPTIGVA